MTPPAATPTQRARRPLLRLIASMAYAVEVRDPYTANHQQRVADLARRIAHRMALAPDTIEAIRIGATLHDVGKVAVPSSILTKPTRLNQHEFGLIRTHAEVGRDILEKAQLPWPVAAILHQHHERLDGSGYPLGLSGDQIMLEARIVAVADVYDAMAENRPYRAAPGHSAAIRELKRQRGRHYDALVVDACVAVLRDGDRSHRAGAHQSA
jgi:putative nucleotidyltransferase with HDIG domain